MFILNSEIFLSQIANIINVRKAHSNKNSKFENMAIFARFLPCTTLFYVFVYKGTETLSALRVQNIERHDPLEHIFLIHFQSFQISHFKRSYVSQRKHYPKISISAKNNHLVTLVLPFQGIVPSTGFKVPRQDPFK